MNTAKCKKQFCSGYYTRATKRFKNINKKAKGKIIVKLPPKSRFLKQCALEYCNPGCKGTLFEAGKSLSKTFKGSKANINFTKNMRKSIFGNKTNVLKNGFYEKLKATNIKRAKNRGALSGCFTIIEKD